MDFRHVPGKRIQWLDTGIDKGFSNFLFIDRDYGSNPVLRRIFSLARKHDYQSLVVDEIGENECASLMLAARLPGMIYLRPGQLQFEIQATQLKGHTSLFAFPTS